MSVFLLEYDYLQSKMAKKKKKKKKFPLKFRFGHYKTILKFRDCEHMESIRNGHSNSNDLE